MRALRKPTDLVEDVFSLCISRVADPQLKMRLQSVSPEIKAAAARFDAAATAGELYKLGPTSGVRDVTAEEMIAVYSGRMAKKGQPNLFIRVTVA